MSLETSDMKFSGFLGSHMSPKKFYILIPPNLLILARKMQENGWRPRWFQKESDNGPFHFVGGYWEARQQGKWDECPNIFGEFNEDLVDPLEVS
nr:oxysterol-binding protein-related protein 2a [Quercus suber]